MAGDVELKSKVIFWTIFPVSESVLITKIEDNSIPNLVSFIHEHQSDIIYSTCIIKCVVRSALKFNQCTSNLAEL